jgi:hypothetical protein
VLQLPKFPHFEGEGGDGRPAVDGIMLYHSIWVG